jgi:hypothetical protein
MVAVEEYLGNIFFVRGVHAKHKTMKFETKLHNKKP